jgi:hypothetical protein
LFPKRLRSVKSILRRFLFSTACALCLIFDQYRAESDRVPVQRN